MPAESQTECIGPDCGMGALCQPFVQVDAFPSAQDPITELVFYKSAASDLLLDVAVKVSDE